jgi:hypothetical protein
MSPDSWQPASFDARHSPALRRSRRVGLAIGAGVLAGCAALFGLLALAADALDTTPTPNVDASVAPLGAPPLRAAEPGTYAFVELTSGGRPVAWDPCRPVRYVINPEGEPAGGRALIDIALASVSRETGLTFFYAGTTRERPSYARALFQEDRYGDRWAPVLITWVTADEMPEFADDRIAQAGSVAYGEGEERAFVTGQVMLGRDKIERMLTERAQAAMAMAVVQHELGHLVGLDHVEDERQLMHPVSRDTLTRWGAGDLAGMSVLGQGPCIPTL